MIKDRLKPITPHQGFTLIELMIALVIASILLGIAVPSFETLIKGNQIVITTNELISALNFARTEAIRRGKQVNLSSGSGDIGWVVWQDLNQDTNLDTGEEIRLWNAIPNNVSLTSTNSVFTFDDSGFVDSPDTFTVCDDRTSEQGNQITLLESGSVSRIVFNCS